MNVIKQKRFWLGLLITLFFLFFVFRRVDLASLWTALVHANYLWLLPALFIYLLGYMVRAIRWKYLLHSIKPIPWTRLLPPLILGFTVNNVLPARAGEIARAYVVGQRENISKSAAFATVVMQRVYDGLVMVFMAAVVFYLFRLPGRSEAVNPEFVDLVNWVINATATLFVLALVLLFVMITWKRASGALLSRLAHLLPTRLGRPLEGILHSFLEGLSVLRSRRDNTWALFFSFLAWIGESAAYYFVLRAFGLQLPPYAAVMLMAVVNLGIMVPSSPGYIGPFEFFGVGTLILFGVDKSLSLPAVLVIHSLVWLPITLWGFYYLWTMKLSWRELETQANAAAGRTEGSV